MKKILLFVLALFFLGACKEEEQSSNNQVEEPSIIGLWHYSKYQFISPEGNVIGEYELDDCTKNSTFEFRPNNEHEAKIYEINENGDCIMAEHEVVDYYYDATNKTLQMADGQVLVSELTDNTLKLDINEGGQDEGSVRLTLIK
ncbi:MAG: hypothetical protein CSA38_04765 [Flavobacteriales bacterium]|nr:MAG: hypothetical protein CSA38_04765 [Flavobacteriales bacterium]